MQKLTLKDVVLAARKYQAEGRLGYQNRECWGSPCFYQYPDCGARDIRCAIGAAFADETLERIAGCPQSGVMSLVALFTLGASVTALYEENYIDVPGYEELEALRHLQRAHDRAAVCEYDESERAALASQFESLLASYDFAE